MTIFKNERFLNVLLKAGRRVVYFFNSLVLRLICRSVGCGVRVIRLPAIRGGKNISIGDNCFLGRNLVMDALAGQLVLGDGVEVRDNVRIYSRGIEVGSRTTLGEGSFLNGRITVGEKAWIARNCDLAGEVCIEQAILGPNVSIIAALGHQRNPVTNAIAMSQRELKEPSVDLSLAKVKVLAGAWIGHGAIVLKGVTINPGVVVGAGSVVTKSFPAGTVVAGNPARPIQSKLSI